MICCFRIEELSHTTNCRPFSSSIDCGVSNVGRELSAAYHVLIVDDEFVIAKTLVAIFSSIGFEAKDSSSASQALQLLEDWQPDFAIIDVVLPGMTGIDLAERIQASVHGCGILLFSGNPSTAHLLAAKANSATVPKIETKPVPPQILIEAVKKHIADRYRV